MTKNFIPQPLAEARRVLQMHPALRDVTEFTRLRDGSHIIDFIAEVPLPTRARAKGQSATGVKAHEPVRFKFPPDYPSRAPTPSLRAKFPSNLPHINPHAANERVPPCISEGSVDELMHRFGFEEIIDQTLEWLSDAAKGFLIKPDHGWEPTRRDDVDGFLRFDAQAVLKVLPDDGSVLTMGSFLQVKKDIGLFELQLERAGQAPEFGALKDTDKSKDQEWARGETTVFFAAAKSLNGERPVYGQYQPDAVVDVPTLLARATELGIDAKRLEKTVNDWLAAGLPFAKKTWPWASELVFAVVLVARRPFKLVSDEQRDVEFIPYMLRVPNNAKTTELRAAAVSGALHMRTLSPQLLARVSGFGDVDTMQGFVVVGCGSVGSKVAAHLGRAGFGNAVFLDNEFFDPHNTARHALSVGVRRWPYKAAEMKRLFESFGHEGTRSLVQDAVALLGSTPAAFQEAMPANCKLVLDSTASLRVAAAAVASPHLQQSQAGRYCRAMLYGQGRVAVLLLEGPGRSPRCDDLMAELYALCKQQDSLRDALGSGSRDPRRVFIGDNCASFTMPMSDSTLSRATAMMAMQVEHWLAQGVPESGGVFVGLSSGIGMQWQEVEVSAATVLESPASLGWSVRLSAKVVQTMAEDANHFKPLETGGVLLGHVDEFSKIISISALADAPPDSTRSKTEFKLGTQGLEAALNTARENSIGYLRYVGTWHSHPMGGQHSGTDKKTLALLALFAAGAPMVSLVWTPKGFHCAVAHITE